MQKIMFNDKYGLTQAVLIGRKTKTRRFLTIPTNIDYDEFEMGIDSNGKVYFSAFYHGKLIRDIYPNFQIGEEVAIAQSYNVCLSDSWITHIHEVYPDISYDRDLSLSPGASNKMFVRADLMPHRIKITDILVERLQDISFKDCIAEGIKEYRAYQEDSNSDMVWFDAPGILKSYNNPFTAFAVLIDKVSGKGTWDSNPYVFVYEFELIK